MFCSNCGKELDDSAVICPSCGCSTENYNKAPQTSSKDAPNIGYSFLGFFFPLIGLILYLVWKAETPLRAKSAGKGALIGVITCAVLVILYVFFALFIFSAFIKALASI